MEIGFSIIKDPIFTSLPIIHETCQHHWLVLFHIPLHKLTVIQFFPIHLLYLTSNSDSHFFSSLSLEVTKVFLFFFFLARQQRLLICEISLWVLYFAGKNSFNETLKNENYIPSRLGLGCFILVLTLEFFFYIKFGSDLKWSSAYYNDSFLLSN